MQEILSVTELTAAIKKQLESRFPALSVKGEVSNLKEQSSGHFYFTLKDQGAQISAVLFRGNAGSLSRLPKNGDQVVLHGELNVYPPRGYYQVIVRKLEYFGVGELLLQLHALKAKLEALGWFATERKKALPKFPRVIGVVTSPTGAVIQDILHVLSRRFRGFRLLLNPVKVQGEGAAGEISRAIESFNRYRLADVLIVGRGGGSLEDLWAFNEEKVASAIFRSQIPIISAVGHETDFSIADFVADVRVPTPTAAAEIATTETVQQLKFLSQAQARLKGIVMAALQHRRKELESIKRHPSLSLPYSLFEPHLQRVDEMHSDLISSLRRQMQHRQLQLHALQKQAMALKPSAQILSLKQKLALLGRSIHAAVFQHYSSQKKALDTRTLRHQLHERLFHHIQQKKERLSQLSSHLKGIDPKNLLTKGYCILFQEKKDSVILSSQELKTQDKVRLQFHDGKAHLTVNGIES